MNQWFNSTLNAILLFCIGCIQLNAQEEVQLFVDFLNFSSDNFTLNTDEFGPNNGDNQWIINEDYDGQSSYPDTPDQTNTNLGQIGEAPFSDYLHVTNTNQLVHNTNYDPNVASDQFTAMTDGVCTIGLTDVKLIFFYHGVGIPDQAYGQVYYSADGGAWTQCGENQYVGQEFWQFEEIFNLGFTDIEDLRFGFRWFNDNTPNDEPSSFAIDDIQIIATYDTSNPVVLEVEVTNDPVCEAGVLTIQYSISDSLCTGYHQVYVYDEFDILIATWALNAPMTYPNTTSFAGLLLPNNMLAGDCYTVVVERIAPHPFIISTASACFVIEECDNSIETLQPAVTMNAFVNGDTTGVCNGSVIDVPFWSYEAFYPGNTYYLQLSDENGDFGFPFNNIGQSDDDTTYDPAFVPAPGMVGGQVPQDALEGCNYYVRIVSSFPGTFGEPWGPFCIKNCDIETNNLMDIAVCITSTEGQTVNIPIDIHMYETLSNYSSTNEFQVEVLDPMTFSTVNIGGLGLVINDNNTTMDVYVPPLPELLMLGLEPGLWYFRIIATDSSVSGDVWGTVIHLTIGYPLDEPLIIIPDIGTICQGLAEYFYILPDQYNPSSTYQWYMNGFPFPALNDPRYPLGVLFSSDVGTVLTIQVQETNFGCVGDMSPPIQITVIGPPVMEIIGPDPICEGDPATFSVPFILETYYSWSVTGGEIIDTGNNLITLRATENGEDALTLSLTAINECGSGSNSITIDVLPVIEFVISDDVTVCQGQNAWLIAEIEDQFILGSFWHVGEDTLLYDQYFFLPQPDTTTVYTYTIQGDICPSHQEVTVFVEPPPVVEITGETLICDGDISILSASGDGTFLWSNGSSGSSIDVTEPGTYWVNFTNALSCEASDSIEIEVTIIETPPIEDIYDLCPGEELNIYAEPDNPASELLLSVSEPGEYAITLVEGLCSEELNVTVNQLSLVTIDLGPDKTGCTNQGIIIATSDGTEVAWSTDEFGSSIEVFTDGVISASHLGNCNEASDEVEVLFEPCVDGCIYFPTAFSPDDNTYNDSYRPTLICEVLDFEMSIYNRWGEIIYVTNDAEIGWNGEFNGELQPVSQYAWKANFTITVQGVSKQFSDSGGFVLVR